MGVGLTTRSWTGPGVGRPKGLMTITGRTPAPNTGITANGSTVSLPLIDIQSALKSANIVPVRPGWLMAPRPLGRSSD